MAATGKTDKQSVTVDPSLSWNVKLGLGALREHLDGIGTATGEYQHKLLMECIWMAEKISADAEAAYQNADDARTFHLQATKA